MRKPYETTTADKRADKSKREGGKADRAADAKGAKKAPPRDGLAKFAKSLKMI